MLVPLSDLSIDAQSSFNIQNIQFGVFDFVIDKQRKRETGKEWKNSCVHIAIIAGLDPFWHLAPTIMNGQPTSWQGINVVRERSGWDALFSVAKL